MQQRHYLLAEEFQIRFEIEERDLHAIASGTVKIFQAIGDLLRIADQLHIAAHDTASPVMFSPGLAIRRGKMGEVAVDSRIVRVVNDVLVVVTCFAFGRLADHHRVDQGAQMPAMAQPGLLQRCGMRGQGLQRRVDLRAGRAGNEHDIGMPCREVETGG